MTMEVRLELDRTLGVYMPGETVKCTWHVTTTEPISFHHLYARCKGEVDTEWQQTQKITIIGRRLILKQYQTLLGSHLGIPKPSGMINIDQPDEWHYKTKIEIHSARNVALGIGKFTFKSQFELPASIPPSLEGNKEAKVVYELKLQSQPNTDLGHRFHFTVAPQLDLSLIFELSNPLMNSEQKTFGIGCMASKPLTATLKIPAASFAPGEKTLVFVDIVNESSTRIVEVRAHLVEMLTFFFGGGETKVNRERTLWTHSFELDEGCVGPKEQQEVFTELYFDPAYKFKFFTDVNFLILAKYFIDVELLPVKIHSKLTFRSQIAIGTTPPMNRLSLNDLVKVVDGDELNNNDGNF